MKKGLTNVCQEILLQFSWFSNHLLQFNVLFIVVYKFHFISSKPDRHCHPSCVFQIQLVNIILRLFGHIFSVGKNILKFQKALFYIKSRTYTFCLPNLGNTPTDFCIKIWERIWPHSQQPVKKNFLWYFKIFIYLEWYKNIMISIYKGQWDTSGKWHLRAITWGAYSSQWTLEWIWITFWPSHNSIFETFEKLAVITENTKHNCTIFKFPSVGKNSFQYLWNYIKYTKTFKNIQITINHQCNC